MCFDKIVAICPDFRSYSKFGPFAAQPLFDHLKSRLFRISDPRCINMVLSFMLVTNAEICQAQQSKFSEIVFQSKSVHLRL